MRNLWMRVGMTLEITEEEEKMLFSDNIAEGEEVIKKIFTEGRWKLDGETYSPYSAVEDFNEQYGTHYEEEDIGWDL